ncbi:mannose-1-phosphate guanylyltransferase [bacterium (Candidatus Blackallbacteria) CG17_big_fil_post_rev_8_21_14_2_50_48_46]|uniref:mannose-1-phosphate guanylyltransferase n=1 Tax=bacterium (Candidatus Blackallbacteria) CG17_big_fil_post_rev_8_21_14_2_50_48_46 TaxID=2014261 RepID=A0A2M7G6A3_9BACT|nr:MAG: mannose-1-phosphate guanylyltransferase [bacterium (Candidatus Blackallbacteria) CG18_big_fil_WC_8_21_14_2_50_49_26]PIW17554.1 MAG: mannose-1-phosphate guanylyltransferase [bacterium (Candidatus Blackallbacteria) CG17_big_fil_post_rev_8_21_14_2_50_48_46]PIW48409.1 MAG: mannose-1-phosphate guanylyltransferase [bacterium (Candidatus Blackallbacteria) CG13_big_fil_rev_8_21_14_2_50_49_14]
MSAEKSIYAVVLAGGSGSRFWPRSRQALPKQLLNIFGENTLIQETLSRLKNLIPRSHQIIITHELQADLIREQLADWQPENLIAEPMGRNTAACIGLAAKLLLARDPNALMLVLPADHMIQMTDLFIQQIQLALDFAQTGPYLVTLGVEPDRPETGYGYLHIRNQGEAICKVLEFVEKPDLERAIQYVSSGDYLWNSGMFIWRADTIQAEMERHSPEIYTALQALPDSVLAPDFAQKLEEVYSDLPPISIDYAVLEKSNQVFTLRGNFGWSDIGSWESVYSLSQKNREGNALTGEVFVKETRNSYIYSPHKFTAVIGVENLIVVDTEDALLICNRDHSQEVRAAVKYLEMQGKDRLL